MTAEHELVFFHNPHSRANMVRALLEELNIPFEQYVLDLRKNEQLASEYLAINPMGKVPAIRHHGVVVTETVAIYIYLADRFPEADLAPALDDPLRGTYLRWLVFYAACFEPAVGDRAMQRTPAPRVQSPYADFDTTLSAILGQIDAGPWLLGEHFTAADVLWGSALRWATSFQLIDRTATIDGYVTRVMARPAMRRALEADATLAAEMGLTG